MSLPILGMNSPRACFTPAATRACSPLARYPSLPPKPINSRTSVCASTRSSRQRCCCQANRKAGSVGGAGKSEHAGMVPEIEPDDVFEFDGTSLMLVIALGAASFFAMSDVAMAGSSQLASHDSSAMPMFAVAEGEDFWANVVRYMRFFVSVMVGTGYVMLKPIGELLKKPRTAILVIGGGALAYVFFKATIESMLGLSNFEYEPSSFVTGGFGG